MSAIPNREGRVSLENSAYAFHDKNWGDILVITSEWAPRDTVLSWARNLCASGTYKNYKVIFMTHSFLREETAERTKDEHYKIQPRNYGQDIWEKLVEPSDNIRLVICGHTGEPGARIKIILGRTSIR